MNSSRTKAGAYTEYLAEKEGGRYSELEAVKALAFYLKTDQTRYEQILKELRPRMQEMQSDGCAMSIHWEA